MPYNLDQRLNSVNAVLAMPDGTDKLEALRRERDIERVELRTAGRGSLSQPLGILNRAIARLEARYEAPDQEMPAVDMEAYDVEMPQLHPSTPTKPKYSPSYWTTSSSSSSTSYLAHNATSSDSDSEKEDSKATNRRLSFS